MRGSNREGIPTQTIDKVEKLFKELRSYSDELQSVLEDSTWQVHKLIMSDIEETEKAIRSCLIPYLHENDIDKLLASPS